MRSLHGIVAKFASIHGTVFLVSQMRLLECMESFVQLAESRNFSRAAKLLGISTSSLSRRIQSLESELGFVLVLRSTRSVALTEQGRQVLARAEHLLREAANLKGELTRDSGEVSGHLRIGAPVDLSITVLGPILAEFCRAHESVQLSIVATQGQPELIGDQLDIAFVIVHQRSLPDSSSTLHRIGAFPRLLFASKDYLVRKGEPASPKDLAQHLCVRHLQEKPETYWDLRSGTKRERVPVNGVCATTCLANAAQAAQQGLGIAMLPAHLARPSSRSASRLIRVLPSWEGSPALVFAIPARDHRLARVSALLGWMRTRVPKRIEQLDAVENSAWA